MMIADWDQEKGTMDIVFFTLGAGTMLAHLIEGESVINKAYSLGRLRKLRCSSGLRLLWDRLHSAAHQISQRKR